MRNQKVFFFKFFSSSWTAILAYSIASSCAHGQKLNRNRYIEYIDKKCKKRSQQNQTNRCRIVQKKPG